jgi:hypothetical protein
MGQTASDHCINIHCNKHQQCPRNVTDGLLNSHFDCFAISFSSRKRFRTNSTCSLCSSVDRLKIKISSRWHHHELVRPIPRADTGFGDILLSNPNLVISRPQINSGKVRCASKTIKQLVLTRDRTLVLHCKLVQSSVLYSASPIRLA